MKKIRIRCSKNLSSHLLLWVTAGWFSGSTLAFLLPAQTAPSYLPLAAVVIFSLATLPLLHFKPTLTPPLCVLLFLGTSYLQTNFALHQPYREDHIANLITGKQQVTVVGTISTMVETDKKMSRFNLEMDEVLLGDDMSASASFRPTGGTVRLTVYHPGDVTLYPGMKIMALAVLDHIRTFRTPGAFDYALHMAGKGIHISGWIRSAKHIVTVRPRTTSWIRSISYRMERLRQNTSAFLQDTLPPSTAALFEALLIGYRGNLPPGLIDRFQQSGCMHLLAISGVHLTLLGSMTAFFIMHCARHSQRILLHTHLPIAASVATLPLLAAYSLLAGMNTPVARAFIMAALTTYTLVSGHRKRLYHLLAATALALLLFNPLLLASASFQLSFAALASIITVYRHPLFFPSQPGTGDRLLRFLRLPVSLMALSVAATLGTLPLLLFHFNRLSLIGPFMNLLIEPLLCFWSLPLGLIAVVLAPFFPEIAVVLIKLAAIGLSLAQSLIEFSTTHLPLTDIHTITPFPFELILYYTLLAAVLVPIGRRLKIFTALSAAVLLSCSIALSYVPVSTSPQTSVHILDVGKGNAVLIQLPSGKNILLDGGGRQSQRFDVGRALIGPFLWRRRIHSLDAVIISHPDADHFNGIPYILEHFAPSTLYINPQPPVEGSAYAQLLHQANRLNINVRRLTAEHIIASSDNVELKNIGVKLKKGEAETLSSNDQSLVILLRHGPHSFLFPGDISATAEARLLAANPDLQAEVLVAPHHGSTTSSSTHFLDALQTSRLVVSSNRIFRADHIPHREIERYIHRTESTILSTAAHGTIEFVTDGEKMDVRTRVLTLDGERR